MARNTDPKCRQCRREGEKLFLKGEKCYTDKCGIERRPYPPGQHGQKGSRMSEFGRQLREKQKIRRIYGVLERQFRKTYKDSCKISKVVLIPWRYAWVSVYRVPKRAKLSDTTA
jgi:small subunit ribosomal protein S4